MTGAHRLPRDNAIVPCVTGESNVRRSSRDRSGVAAHLARGWCVEVLQDIVDALHNLLSSRRLESTRAPAPVVLVLSHVRRDPRPDVLAAPAAGVLVVLLDEAHAAGELQLPGEAGGGAGAVSRQETRETRNRRGSRGAEKPHHPFLHLLR